MIIIFNKKTTLKMGRFFWFFGFKYYWRTNPPLGEITWPVKYEAVKIYSNAPAISSTSPIYPSGIVEANAFNSYWLTPLKIIINITFNTNIIKIFKLYLNRRWIYFYFFVFNTILFYINITSYNTYYVN